MNFSHKFTSLFRIAFVVMVMFLPVSCVAQRGDVKKSTKTETIEGKKYYLHTVEKQQTLYAIAKAYDLNVNDIVVENPDALNGIKPGQVLRIPAQKPVAVFKPVVADTGYFIHHVKAGETLYGIENLYKVSHENILKLNPTAKGGIKAGEDLKIPGKNPNPKVIGTIPVAGPDTLFIENKKATYTIGLMLPLQLYNVDNIDTKQGREGFPAKSKAAVEFYEGVLLAVDSMRKTGMKVNLYVYDIDEGDSVKVLEVLKKPEFKFMDMILGPLSPAPFYAVSSWANEHHVAVVSPVSPANRVLFKRPDASKALPALSTQMEQLASFVGEHHKADNVIMVTSGNMKEQAAANTFRINVSKLLFPGMSDTIKTTRGISGLEALLKKDKNNILVIPSNSQAYVSDLLRSLNTLSDKYVITVYGLSAWMGYDNLDLEYLQKLQFHFVAPYFIEYDSSATTKRFLSKYNSTFHGDAGMYAFSGYDVGLYYLQALNMYGTNFYQKLPEIKGTGLQQDFDFYKSDVESGYENRAVRIVQVVDYRLVRIK
ncbi:MAG: LysM peptidoglycan-binding domain-containing protein [Bacteroidota bacterium]|nr:LysM peptidoglycan-binding domain-containing protein [Bacteroidota bacterium]